MSLPPDNPRFHGRPPYCVAVLHGGPGGPGSAAPLARELGRTRGVLEPLQTAASVEGQISELYAQLTHHAALPVTLVGWSWGAMLGFLFTARHPEMVRKLILVSSGLFDERYAAEITPRRESRLNEIERQTVRELQAALTTPDADRDAILARLAQLYTMADTYDPLTLELETLAVQADLHVSVWSEAQTLRTNGTLLDCGKNIRCPVIAIHGDYDSHPEAGVREPLARTLRDFRFHLLEHCGHVPWMERQARAAFFRCLETELDRETPTE